MQVKQRLNALISMLGITKSEFAKAIKVSPGNVSDWFNKENSNPGQAALKRICEVYNVNLNWLLTGEGPRQNWDMNSALKRLGLEPVPLDEPEPRASSAFPSWVKLPPAPLSPSRTSSRSPISRSIPRFYPTLPVVWPSGSLETACHRT
jgi:transcriptional regulator with XRE-family HTH domain